MTTARQAAPRAGYRHQRRIDKQRRLREELLVVGVLLVLLLVTVGLLALQWLHGGQTSNGAGIPVRVALGLH
jgi:Tfp pilus assembly protein PilN